MRLDRHARAAKANGLNNIRIQRSLDEKFSVADLFRLTFEDVNKESANDLSFLFGIGNVFQCFVKFFRGVDADHIQMKIVAVHLQCRFEFVFSQQPIVNKYTGLPFTDRFMDKNGRHR